MKEYKVYFEIYGKKMVSKVKANNKEDARDIVLSKIKFYKIEPNEYDEIINDHIDKIKNALGL